MTYEVSFTCDLGALLPSVGETLAEVNKYMAELGFSEKVGMTSQFPLSLKVSGLRMPTVHEQAQVGALVLDCLQKQFPQYLLELKSVTLFGADDKDTTH